MKEICRGFQFTSYNTSFQTNRVHSNWVRLYIYGNYLIYKMSLVHSYIIFAFFLFQSFNHLQVNECRQAKRDLRDVESLRQNCRLFDVIEIAVPRKKM